MVRPKLVVSSCLTGEKVRYDGRSAEDPVVSKIIPYCDVIKVCPEVSLGLGVPRPKIYLYKVGGRWGVYQPESGRDITKSMVAFARRFIKEIKEVDGFLLKSKSPSCGVSLTKFYSDREGKNLVGISRGIFAREVIKAFPEVPVEDEMRLKDVSRLRKFLFLLFGHAYLKTGKVKSPERLKKILRRVAKRGISFEEFVEEGPSFIPEELILLGMGYGKVHQAT